MKHPLLAAAIVLLCIASTRPLFSQESDARARYDSLRARVEAADTLIDYHAFRMAYAETDLYSISSNDDVEAMYGALDEEKWEEAIEHGLKGLEQNYTSMRAHYGLSIAYHMLKQPDKARFHKAVEMGLLRAIIHTGDGKTPETAWKVLTVDEEYFILGMIDMDVKGQALIQDKNGEPVDKMKVTDTENGEEKTYYFNVSISFRNMNKLFNTEE
jgi:hypothetical protein